jgi:hypothetical protein
MEKTYWVVTGKGLRYTAIHVNLRLFGCYSG